MNLKRLATAILATLSFASLSPAAQAGTTANGTSLVDSTVEQIAQANEAEQAVPPQGQSVPLQCQSVGSIFFPKTPKITNTGDEVIPTGTTIFWQASDHDSGQVTLTQPLKLGASISAIGQQSGSYTCTAKYFRRAQS